MSVRHCICAALALLVGSAPMAAQPSAAVEPGATASFMIFIRGTVIGAEQMTVIRAADGWTILSTGRMGPPFDVVAHKVEVRYTSDWKPLEFTLDSTVRGE